MTSEFIFTEGGGYQPNPEHEPSIPVTELPGGPSPYDGVTSTTTDPVELAAAQEHDRMVEDARDAEGRLPGCG